jgi:hypothetical protein
MLTHVDEMRKFIEVSREERMRALLEAYVNPQPAPAVELPPPPDKSVEMLAELKDLIARLQSYQELADNQDYAMGVEVGLQMASEMIEHIIHKYQDSGE